MKWEELSAMYSVPKVRVRFQDKYFLLTGIACDDKDAYCRLESPNPLGASESLCYLVVRMSDLQSFVMDNIEAGYTRADNAPSSVVNLTRLALDASVEASKVQQYLLKLKMNFNVRRNWFGGVEFERLKPRKLHERDADLVDSLLLNFEYGDEEIWNQIKRLVEVGSDYQLTLRDILMGF